LSVACRLKIEDEVSHCLLQLINLLPVVRSLCWADKEAAERRMGLHWDREDNSGHQLDLE
jgi:hypothetical protein